MATNWDQHRVEFERYKAETREDSRAGQESHGGKGDSFDYSNSVISLSDR